MFAIVKNKSIQSMLQSGSAFMHDDVQYPANWINIATPEQKAVVGLVDVVRAQRPDDRFYWVGESEPAYNADTNQVEIAYTATPKELDATKASEVTAVKSAAFSILSPTDYIDARNLRDPSYKPEWMTWREAVLTACRAHVAVIEACTSVDEIAALPAVVWPDTPAV